MNDEQLHTLADLQAFLTETVAMNFTVTSELETHSHFGNNRRTGFARHFFNGGRSPPYWIAASALPPRKDSAFLCEEA
ncbi:MAG: hypothetical protein Q7T21_13695 [Gallionella sp.]|nr:hypothetical protein [Gallionella sp.]